MGNDQRKSRRRAVSYLARLELRPGRSVGCILSDISDSGARLSVPYPDKVPDRFPLWLTETGSARRICTVVWRKARELGVKFDRHVPAGQRAALEPLDDAAAARRVIINTLASD